MKTHKSYTIAFTSHAALICSRMNELVRELGSVPKATEAYRAKYGWISKTSARRYYMGSYDVNKGFAGYTSGQANFTCIRLGASVAI